MNFAGKFDLKAAADGFDIHSYVKLDALADHGGSGIITVADPQLLFTGEYKRSGLDLIVSKDERELVVQDYFKGEKRASLASPDGARLTGEIITALTGHVQYAQASGAADAGKVIGHVTKLAGNATVLRNGVSVVLNMGDNVYKGDVVQAGSDSQLGITFIDGTVFGLSSNARMVLNEMVYDPNGSSNSSLLSLVAGTITFVAGETAKHGDMKVATPVATMGIRGTAVLAEIGFAVPTDPASTATAPTQEVKLIVLQEPDGKIGFVEVTTVNGQVVNLTASSPLAAFNAQGQVSANIQPLSEASKAIISEVFSQKFPNLTLPDIYRPSTDQQQKDVPADQRRGDNDKTNTDTKSTTTASSSSSATSDGTKTAGLTDSTKPVTGQPVVIVPVEVTVAAPTIDNANATKVVTVQVTVLTNTAPTIEVANVINKPTFKIADQVHVTDPDTTNPTFNDVVVPYVPGTGHIVSVAGTATIPAGVDPASLISIDAQTGAISYDAAKLAFMPEGKSLVFNVGFDSQSGPDTVHETLTYTIDGVNDSPTITNASLVVSNGGTVLLGPSNVVVADPDSTSFTFKVSNVTHGRFQISTDGVNWTDFTPTTSFTTSDLNSGHVRFIHTAGEAAPTFSIQADDGTTTNDLSDVHVANVNFLSTDSIPALSATNGALAELAGSGSGATDTATGNISFTDVDLADRPVVAASFTSLSYSDAQHHDITSTLTPAQLSALEAPLAIAPAAGNSNNGSAAWTYSIADSQIDFLSAGETLTLIYSAQVDDGHGGTASTPLTVTITGTNDAPAVAAGATTASGLIVVAANSGAAAHSSVSPSVAAQLNQPGLISGLPGETGYGTLALGAGDDNSSDAIDITSVFGAAGLNFFGHNYTSLFVNNNGNVSFAHSSGAYSVNSITAGADNPVIAAFWADVDTRGAGSVYYDLDPVDGVMTITWDHVGYYSFGSDKLNTFQLVLINEGDGNFDISYRYADIQWTGGTPARAGYSAGDDQHYLELPQSGDPAQLLTLPTTPGNTHIAGVDDFQVRNGEVSTVAVTSTGTIGFSDADLRDVHAVQSVTYTGADTALGTLTLVKNADTTGIGSGGQFNWTYSADPSAVRNALDGVSTHSKVETFDVVIADGNGGTFTQTVSVTLTEAINQAPTGSVTISGSPEQDQTLTASNTLADADGIGTISYQWQRDGVDVGGATGGTYTLGNADVGHAIDVVASYTDGHGTNEHVASAATTPIAVRGVIIGDNGNNTLTGTPANDSFQGFGGDDTIIGLAGVDRAIYTDATGGIIVDMAAGTVSGAGVGADTLDGIESIQGSKFVDHYTATGFTGNPQTPGVPLGFNAFEGMGGDDVITGSVNVQGQKLTRVSYLSAASGVTVDIAAGTGQGTAPNDAAGVGQDHFTNVNAIIGSNSDDVLRGSDNPNGTYEQYEGRGGNDLIDGRGGYDFANYANDPTQSAITVNMAAGTVTGDSTVGTDTLRSVEGVRGTQFADHYDASGFSGTSTNAGSLGTFNNFDGQGGDDVIIGNGNTRIQYTQSLAAVFVDFQQGKAQDLADHANGTHLDAANVGVDTFTGVTAVMGSMFNDTLLGGANNETFQGLAGDDFINGRGGFDVAQYNNMTYTTGGISVDFAAGTVTGDASNGTDTLRSIEGVQGTNFADTFSAAGYGAPGLDPTTHNVGNNGTYNQFEGLGGDDTITGNDNTRILYTSALGGVTVDLAAGTAHGTAPDDAAGVGHDIIMGGVNGVVGSAFADTLLGSDTADGVNEYFDGRGGNDTIDGRGGFDVAIYNIDPSIASGIHVDMATGQVIGDAAVGTDTLISVESVTGTRFDDTYDASALTANSPNAGNFGLFNEFQAQGGNDTVHGNGFTQLAFYYATGGVTVDFQTGTATGNAAFGSVNFSGVSAIQGSNYNDSISGSSAGNEYLNGQGGDDRIDGRGGNGDFLAGGAGADTFVYAAGYGFTTIDDFNATDGDKVDLTGVSGVYNIGDVQSRALDGNDGVVITFSTGNTLTLNGVQKADLTADDFVFAVPNHAPVITAGAGDSADATLAETNAGLSTQGTLTVADADQADTVTVSAIGVTHTGPTGGLTDAQLQSYFSVPSAAVLTGGQGSNHFAWQFNSQNQAFDFLANGETLTLHYTVQPSDGHTQTGSGNSVVTINITGTNDGPVITSGPVTGILTEDSSVITLSGTVAVNDPDDGATKSFVVQNNAGTVTGPVSHPANFSIAIDDFTITNSPNNANGATVRYHDTFSGTAPNPGYGFTGAFVLSTDSSGRSVAVLDAAHAAGTTSFDGTQAYTGDYGTLRTYNSDNNTGGVTWLKQDQNYTAQAIFDLSNLQDINSEYGIRLFDKVSGANDNGRVGVEIVVRDTTAAVVQVQLRQIDLVTGVVTNVQSITLNNLASIPAGDQIALRLMHSANSNAVSASFDILDSSGAVVTSNFASSTFNLTGHLYDNGENWTRAQIFADEPTNTAAYLSGQYGALSITPAGAYTYTDRSGATQSLGEGQTAADKFLVKVTDDLGATTTTPVTFTIQGVNDAPVVTSAVLTVSEGGTVLLTSLDGHVTDPDSTFFTYTVSNLTHGNFQTTTDGTNWTDTTTFSTADLNAGHVRFVHDGGEVAPAFSIQANDGAAHNNLSNVFAGTVHFTNVDDAPTVTAGSGDSAGTATPLAETNGTLTAQGTSTLSDPDGTDPVTVAVDHVDVYLNGVLQSGAVGGLSHADLLGYFAVPSAAVLTVPQTSAHFAWNFNSQGQAFDFLAAGQMLSLQYFVRPNDGNPQAGTGDGVVTINIAGTDDAPVAHNDVFGTPDLDLVTVAFAGNGVALYNNDGTGHFNSSGPALLSSALSLAVGDVNGDGAPDIVVGTPSGAPTKVYLNDGHGAFSDSGQSLGTNSTESVVLADLNGDGSLDLVEATDSGQYDRVWFNNGSGTFTDSGQTIGSDSDFAVAVGDVNGDGKPDIVTTSLLGASQVYLNNGSGIFYDSGQVFGSGDSRDVVLADLDGDGDLDLAKGGSSGTNQIWLNDGQGTFTAGQTFGTGTTYRLTVGDVNGDGAPDIVTADGQSVHIYLNDGHGVFTDSGQNLSIPAGGGLAVNLGDIDGDGDPDLVVAVESAPDRIFLNNGAGIFTDSGQALGGSEGTRNAVFGDLDGDATSFAANAPHVLNVLGNDSDAEADVLSVSAADSVSTLGATLTVNSDGTINYDPSAAASLIALGRGEFAVDHFSYTASDGHGGTNAATVSIRIAGVNDSPVLDAATLAAVAEDTAEPAGQTVAALFAGKFHDVDHGSSFAGIAVIANNANAQTEGVWQYQSVEHGYWEDVGAATDAEALAFSPTTMLRFVPAANFSGTPTGLSVYGLDNTFDADDYTIGGVVGGTRYTINTTNGGDEPLGHGGGSPVSAVAVTLGTAVTPVNDPPVISLGANYATFNGASKASTPDSTVVTTQIDNVTLEGWVDWNGGGGSNGQLLFYNGSGSTTGFGLLGIKNGQSLSLTVLSGGVAVSAEIGSVAANEWHHLALTRSGGTFNLYVDGQLQQSFYQDVNPIDTSDDGDTNRIDTTQIGDGFNGSIGEVRIWTEAHDAAQINQYKNVSLTGGEPNLVGYWRLNDATGTTADDATTGNHNLSLSGGAGFVTNSAGGWPQTAVATMEDTSVTIGGVSIGDVDAGNADIAVSLHVDHGSLEATYNGGTISSNSSGALNLPLNSIGGMNAVLATLQYTPGENYFGSDSLSVMVDDLGNSGSGGFKTASSSVAISVTPVNDAPVASNDAIANAVAPSAADGWVLDSDNGHYYRLVNSATTWVVAEAAALADGGYLATITNAAEDDFIKANVPGTTSNRVWIGASDDSSQGASEGVWKWVTGPEAGTQFWSGGANGTTFNGEYADWRSGEPTAGAGENFAHMEQDAGGQWNDAPDNAGGRIYLEEWGGLAGQIAFRENTGTTLTVAELLGHASDSDGGDTLSLSSIGGVAVSSGAATAYTAHGTITLSGGIITYTPGTNYSGPDSFAYAVKDGAGAESNIATVSFSVIADNVYDLGIGPGLVSVSGGLAGSDNVSHDGSIVLAVSTDGVDFTAVAPGSTNAGGGNGTLVHGTYVDFLVGADGSDSLILRDNPDASDLISLVEGNETNATPLRDTFYYKVSDADGSNVRIDKASWTLDDLTFDGLGPDAVPASAGQPLTLSGLAVHDNGAGQGPSDSITVSLFVGDNDGVLNFESGYSSPASAVMGESTNTLTFVGTAAQINLDLDHVTFTGGEGRHDILLNGVDGPVHSASYRVGTVDVAAGMNSAPHAYNDANHDMTNSQTAASVSGNVLLEDAVNGTPADSDPDGDPISVDGVMFGNGTPQVGVLSAAGDYGNLAISGDGSYTYTPAFADDPDATAQQKAAYAALSPQGASSPTETFTYEITDDHGNGGVTATLTIDVFGVNDAPVLTSTAPTLMSVDYNNIDPSGQTVASFLGNNASDADGDPVGIAIISSDAEEGTWQFSTDGSSWTAFTGYSESAALLLDANDFVRFVPGPGAAGNTANTFTYVAWDETTGTHGLTVDASNTGGSTAFSVDSDTATIAVNSQTANTANAYIGADGGDWSTDTNWSLGHVPVSGEGVLINDGNVIVSAGTTATASDGTTIASGKTVTIQSGATLTLTGAIENSGLIDVDLSAFSDARLKIGGGVTLTGGGHVSLDSTSTQFDSIVAISGSVLFLDNVDNTISGAGQIGDGNSLPVTNGASGAINATGGTLTFHTNNTITNHGLLEATVAGTLDVQDSVIHNTGTGPTQGIYIDGTSKLLVDTFTLQLSGNGNVSLAKGSEITENSSNQYVVSSGMVLVLDNVDNAISGAGKIGNGSGYLALHNDTSGIIDADVDGQMLTIDTGLNRIENHGEMNVTGGHLDIVSAISGGSSTIDGGTLEFHSGSNVAVDFVSGGTLILDDVANFTGTISGVEGEINSGSYATDDIQIGVGQGTVTSVEGDSLDFHYNADHPDVIVAIDSGDGNILHGTAGNDIYVATASSDSFQFNVYSGSGNDTITNFITAATQSSHSDTIDLFVTSTPFFDAEGSYQTWASETAYAGGPQHVTQSGLDTLITIDQSDSILIKNLALTSLHFVDFAFTQAAAG